MVLRWTPTKQDVRLAARTARLSAPFLVRNRSRLALALILGLLVVLQVAGLHVWPAMSTPITFLVLSAGQDGTAWLRPSVRAPAEAVLTEDEIRLNRRHAWPWSAVRFVVETDQQYVLVSAKERTRFVAYLPKRAIEDPAAVRALLAAEREVRPG